MTELKTLVTVIDDDVSVRESLPELLRTLGFDTKAFSSAEEFLNTDSVSNSRCLILDVAMPGMSGIELQQELRARGHRIPIIFITAQSDKRIRDGLLEKGAVECLFKPFSELQLSVALNAALPGN